MRAIIAGGRDYRATEGDLHILDRIGQAYGITEVVCGGAPGADQLGAYWAGVRHQIPVKVFPADWDAHGKAAGPIRNEAMAQYARGGLCILFPGGRGTGSMRGCATRAGILVLDPRVPLLDPTL